MSLIDGFNADEVPSGNAIPKGTQAICLVTEVNDVQSKTNPSNWMLKVTVEVVDGSYKGQKIWPNFNIKNSNETAERIAKSQLAQLCLAIGVPRPQSNSELLNKPFRATFGDPQDFNGEQQSLIKKYDPPNGSQGVVSGLAPASGTTGKPAWAR